MHARRRAAGGDLYVHFGTVEEGEIGAGVAVHQRVDADRRRFNAWLWRIPVLLAAGATAGQETLIGSPVSK